ncbi:hypothetical protein Hanom_Chr10g00965911 [Helianthus anomalus]
METLAFAAAKAMVAAPSFLLLLVLQDLEASVLLFESQNHHTLSEPQINHFSLSPLASPSLSFSVVFSAICEDEKSR